MNIPYLISFEVTNVDNGYPYAVAWSLPDGQYKTALIRPEEDWLIDFEGGHNPDAPPLQDLLDKGESVLDVIKEWAQDFDTSEIYCQDPVLAQYCFDMMYEAYDKECEFDLISEYDLYSHHDSLDIDDQRRWIMDTEGLTATNCEDVIKTMIFLFSRTGT